MKLSNNMKTALVGLLVVIVIAVLYFTYPLFSPSAVFDKGNEINSDTFVELLADADTVYIVMDLRYASSDQVRSNIMQCGIDFAGSYGLANRNVKYMSLDPVEKCIMASQSGGSGTYGINECLDMLKDGVSLYVIEGDGTKYYTKAAMVGINESYVMGMCSVGEKYY